MLDRIRRSPALMALAAFAILAVLVFGWWTISPLFIRTSLNEGAGIAVGTPTPAAMMNDTMPAKATPTAEAMMEQPTPTSEAMKEKPGDTMAGEASPTPDAMMSKPDTMMAEATPTPEAMKDGGMLAEPSATPEAMMGEPGESMMGPLVLAAGSFDRKDAVHYASGQAIIARQEDGSFVVRLQDVDAANGPDLYVYVSEHPDPMNAGELNQGGHNLGGLKATNGSFNYTLDPSIDPARIKSVVIYCRAFSVIFSTAKLAPPGS